MKKHIIVDKAVSPIGPYSHAVIANGFVYVSGQGPIIPNKGEIPTTFREQVFQTLENIRVILEGAGSSLDSVIKVQAYLSDLSNFQTYNDVYQNFFSSDPPARTTIGAKLPFTICLRTLLESPVSLSLMTIYTMNGCLQPLQTP